MNPNDRRRGALLGLAVGDALGASIEFQHPGDFEPVTGYARSVVHGIPAGAWTDDTSMALAMASTMEGRNWSPEAQAKAYVRWWQDGEFSVNGMCFDIGTQTRHALQEFIDDGNPFFSEEDESQSGNGSIMRLAPVPIAFARLRHLEYPELLRCAAESSRVTHSSKQCVSACQYLALVMAGLMLEGDRDVILSPQWYGIQQIEEVNPIHPLIRKVIDGSYRTKKPPEIRGSGWVVQSLEAALWAFHDAPDFETAVLKAVNLGDDSDTTGAICGQLAGAYWGESGIPQHLLDGLVRREMIEEALTRLGCEKH